MAGTGQRLEGFGIDFQRGSSLLEVKDATIEALRAEIAKLQRAGQKDEKKQAAVAAAVKG